MFVGPLLLILTTISERIMGNFFPMGCSPFAVFWLSFSSCPRLSWPPQTLPQTNTIESAVSVQYNAALVLYLIVWGFALFTFFIFTLKTNTISALIFLFIATASWVLAGA
jgi:succinate-acetate transporter protein